MNQKRLGNTEIDKKRRLSGLTVVKHPKTFVDRVGGLNPTLISEIGE